MCGYICQEGFRFGSDIEKEVDDAEVGLERVAGIKDLRIGVRQQ